MTKAHTLSCSVAATLNILGDAWTLLVVREAFYGSSRFSDFQRHIGIAKNILSDRLSLLIDEGIFEKVDSGVRGQRYEYFLTAKGKSLNVVLLAMMQWGDRWAFGAGNEPVLFENALDQSELSPLRATWKTGANLTVENTAIRPGPGADAATLDRFASLGITSQRES
ncbi:MAG: helix-turn-helix domain-containing protein [Pseudomonadota bacterium]